MLRGQRLNFGGGPNASAFVKAAGSFCSNFKTGAKRSPTLAIRFTAASAGKTRPLVSFRFTARANSSQVIGNEISGWEPFARIE